MVVFLLLCHAEHMEFATDVNVFDNNRLHYDIMMKGLRTSGICVM